MTAATFARGLTTVATGVRPCSRWDSRMWETGNPGNTEAIEMCDWCPFKARCRSDNPDPRGVVVAGVPYDDYGRPTVPGAPPLPEPDDTAPRRTAEYHDEIMRRHAAGDSWTKIAISLRLSRYAVRGYGQRQLAARKRRVAT